MDYQKVIDHGFKNNLGSIVEMMVLSRIYKRHGAGCRKALAVNMVFSLNMRFLDKC